MNRSTALILAAAATGLPSFFIEVNPLPASVKAAWLAIMATLALAGFFYWAKDRA